MPLFAKKYKILFLLTACLVLGFALMSGPSGSNPGFDETVFSFRRISLAPIVVVASYAGFMWLILKKPSN